MAHICTYMFMEIVLFSVWVFLDVFLIIPLFNQVDIKALIQSPICDNQIFGKLSPILIDLHLETNSTNIL